MSVKTELNFRKKWVCSLSSARAKMLQLQAVGASSTDDRHPAEHCLDGNQDTFWLTTGLFPQELVISLPSPVKIAAVHLRCSNVKQVSIQNSTEETPEGFTELAKSDFQSQAGHVQSEQLKLQSPVLARHLKLVITKAYAHFVSIHSINIIPT